MPGPRSGESWSHQVEAVLGLTFADPGLLQEAFTHSSYANEQPDKPADNERLEFLGDAVVGLAVSEALWRRLPEGPEGELARIRAAVVNEGALADQTRRLGLGRFLRVGRGEEKTGGRDRDSLLCDVFEAVVGAIFLVHGWPTARDFVLQQLAVPLVESMGMTGPGDAKSRLQERMQAERGHAPTYRLQEAHGPDHDRRFSMEVTLGQDFLGSGTGRSKKEAEQAAASAALRRLEVPVRKPDKPAHTTSPSHRRERRDKG